MPRDATQDVVTRAVQHLGDAGCIAEAVSAAMALHQAALWGEIAHDRLARLTAQLELSCDQLRHIAGSGLVDLHKVEALAALQQRLR